MGRRGKRGVGAVVLVSTLALSWLILALPNSTAALAGAPQFWPPLELAILLALLWVTPQSVRRWLTALCALALTTLLLLKMADMMALQAYWRIFDPLADWHLVGPGWDVLQGALGEPRALLLALGVALGLLLVFMLLLRGLSRLGRWRSKLPGLALLLLAGALLGWQLDERQPLAGSTQLVAEHVTQSRQNLRDLAALQARVCQDERVTMAPQQLLDGLRGHDVLFVFIESYGRVALDQPRYGETLRPRLERIERELGGAGFDARSAWLRAPTVGGQSWLSHATLQSGLWIDSQRRYNWLMGTDRASLAQLFERAGWRTLAVAPALTRDWSSNAWYRFQKVYDSRNLGYEGRPFNWVTMPDQYTFAALERLELSRRERAPIMAEVATVSSHAPWTPIPPLIDWAQVGDGRIFNRWADAGDPPDVVWQDSERVRRQYLKAIDYALSTAGAFVTHYSQSEPENADDLVVIVMGDHQPATLITGEGASRDVPVHVISRDSRVLDTFSRWGWSAGMLPAERAPRWGMDEVRPRLIEGFSAETP